MAEIPPVRMLIFGDSWARSMSADMRTWPELMADRLHWPSINAAIPGGDSSKLLAQLEQLRNLFAETGATVDEDAWALIHAGGNDIMHAMGGDFMGFVTAATGNAVCCCAPCCCRLPVFEEVVDNVEELVHRLDEDLGIRNVIVVGLPLTSSLPFISQLLEMFAQTRCLSSLAHFVLRRLNATYNRMLARRLQRLHRVCDDSSRRTIVLDEAAAIDACSKKEYLSVEAMWKDGIHLTQLGHEALADEMFARAQALAGASSLESVRTLDSGSDAEE